MWLYKFLSVEVTWREFRKRTHTICVSLFIFPSLLDFPLFLRAACPTCRPGAPLSGREWERGGSRSWRKDSAVYTMCWETPDGSPQRPALLVLMPVRPPAQSEPFQTRLCETAFFPALLRRKDRLSLLGCSGQHHCQCLHRHHPWHQHHHLHHSPTTISSSNSTSTTASAQDHQQLHRGSPSPPQHKTLSLSTCYAPNLVLQNFHLFTITMIWVTISLYMI